MNPQAALLKASIDADIREIESLYERLANCGSATTVEQAIVVGYYLHNLYNAFENICLNVAKTFENQIDDRSQWHAVLLKRMTLDIEGLRPKLLSAEVHQCLDELRRFRHVFRNAYNIELDHRRIAIVTTQAKRLQTLYKPDLDEFKTFLDSLPQYLNEA